MLRSLVGSEMCIRDSPWTSHAFRRNPCFCLSLNQRSVLSLAVSQPTDSHLIGKRLGRVYPVAIGFVVARSDSFGGSPRRIRSTDIVFKSHLRQSREVSTILDLAEGAYVLFPCAGTPGHEGPFSLTVLCDHKISMEGVEAPGYEGDFLQKQCEVFTRVDELDQVEELRGKIHELEDELAEERARSVLLEKELREAHARQSPSYEFLAEKEDRILELERRLAQCDKGLLGSPESPPLMKSLHEQLLAAEGELDACSDERASLMEANEKLSYQLALRDEELARRCDEIEHLRSELFRPDPEPRGSELEGLRRMLSEVSAMNNVKDDQIKDLRTQLGDHVRWLARGQTEVLELESLHGDKARVS
eukprot:TRINITY_DN15218_c0_g1_i6.p1 TRINITY_DN15218_c0_g1~~TRINITY_DN15218_c0_g1_i6.p1  ORF type:complete len:391 (+),score=98.37 TRINITY_DN15218_c0_g1_i6:89-1174(+)